MLKRSLMRVMLCALSLCVLSACAVINSEETSISEESTITYPMEPTTQSLQETTVASGIKLVALEVGMASDSLDGGTHVSECEFWDPEITVNHLNDAAAETTTVTVNGISYMGIYNYSRVNIPETFRTDYYVFAEDNGEFAVNSATGELVEFILTSPGDRTQGDLSAEDCLEAANTFASLFADISEYTLTVRPGEVLHGYTYTKYIDGVETGEYFNIGVTTAGKARMFSSSMLGAFTSETSVLTTKELDFEQSIDLLSSDQAEAVLVEKINTIYADLDKVYLNPEVSYSYEIKDSKLIILPDDTLGMLYIVEVDISTPTEKGTAHSPSLTQIIIKSE